jgi:hypothetical protein
MYARLQVRDNYREKALLSMLEGTYDLKMMRLEFALLRGLDRTKLYTTFSFYP